MCSRSTEVSARTVEARLQFRPPHDMLLPAQEFAVISIAGPKYPLETKQTQLVVHRAFARLEDAKVYCDTFRREKEQTSLFVVRMFETVALANEPENMRSVAYQRKVCGSVLTLLQEIHDNTAARRSAADFAVASDAAVVDDDGDHEAKEEQKFEEAAAERVGDDDNDDDWWREPGTEVVTTTPKTTFEKHVQHERTLANMDERPLELTKKTASGVTEVLSMSTYAATAEAKCSATALPPAIRTTQPPTSLSSMVSTPACLAMCTAPQHYCLIQMISRSREMLTEPIIILRGLFESESKADRFALALVKRHPPHLFHHDMVVIPTDTCVNPWYKRSQVQKIVFSDDKENRMAQRFHDGKRENKEQLTKLAAKQAEFDRKKAELLKRREETVTAASAGGSKLVAQAAALVKKRAIVEATADRRVVRPP